MVEFLIMKEMIIIKIMMIIIMKMFFNEPYLHNLEILCSSVVTLRHLVFSHLIL